MNISDQGIKLIGNLVYRMNPIRRAFPKLVEKGAGKSYKLNAFLGMSFSAHKTKFHIILHNLQLYYQRTENPNSLTLSPINVFDEFMKLMVAVMGMNSVITCLQTFWKIITIKQKTAFYIIN